MKEQLQNTTIDTENKGGNSTESLDRNQVLSKIKDYINNKVNNLKIASLMLLTVGSMEVASAQDKNSEGLSHRIDDIKSGRSGREMVVNDLYDKYKKNNIDSTYYLLEVFNNDKYVEPREPEKTSETVFSGMVWSDSKELKQLGLDKNVSLGSIQFKEYSASLIDLEKTDNDNDTSEDNEQYIFKCLGGFSFQNDVNKNEKIILEDKPDTLVGNGDSPETAFAMALSNLSLSSSLVEGSTEGYTSLENQSGNVKEENRLISLFTTQTDHKIYDVKVLITKQSEEQYEKDVHRKFRSKEAYNQMCYKAEIVYKDAKGESEK